eukprot:TRINITY_DN1699_c0_g1_i1.p1 TRINITY_DN1699_c0_g1~~TRINITY_DN1699_c0_g1_i1.p1  ORF type:complete len:201 (+),score=38.20 TRINITY_DN1699_c0_g1_i1:632-1234(+)
MLQHYLVSMNTNNSAGMIDISKLIHDTFTVKELEKHIFNDEGGSSKAMLEYILEPGSKTGIVGTSELNNTEKYLKEYGPLLVAAFRVHSDFLNSTRYIYHGKTTGKLVGYHAMVVIGTRTDKNRKMSFLLQNWWKEKQFVEVDLEYLRNSQSELVYVTTPQHTIPTKFPTTFALFAENENLDKPESFPLMEGPIRELYYQ